MGYQYSSYLERIAASYEAFLEQNAAWIRRQEEWRAEDLARREQWEEQEQARFERRLESDNKVLEEFHARLEKIYREEVQRDLDTRRISDLLKKEREP